MRLKAGTESFSVYFHLRSSADGTEKTGLTSASAGAAASYVRDKGARVAISLSTLAAADSAYSSGGMKEVDGTNAKGLYRLDIPNAAIVAGVNKVVVHMQFDGVFAESLLIELTTKDEADFALASVCTEGRLSELDAANIPGDIDAILAAQAADNWPIK